MCPAQPKASSGLVTLTRKQATKVGSAESDRRRVVTVSTGILVDFTGRLLMGDSSLSGKDPARRKGLATRDAETLKALQGSMSLYPRSFDWMNDPSANLLLSTLQKVITLFIQNASRTELHLFDPQQPSDPTTVARATRPMTIFPAFFEPWQDPLGPVLAITHEYFHYLNVPGTRERIFHSNPYKTSVESALGDAYSLSSLALRLAFGRVVNGK